MTVIFPRPSNNEEALTLALTLAITAPAGSEALDWLIATAEGYAADLDAATVETCKAAALERADRFRSFEYPDEQHAETPTPQALDALAPSKKHGAD
jgi:hypothetical protein